jgi:beta-galactosidase
VKVTRVESLRPGVTRDCRWKNRTYACGVWSERMELSTGANVQGNSSEGEPVIVESKGRYYIGVWPTRELASDVVSHVLEEAGISATRLEEDVRIRRRGGITFAFNFGIDSCPTPAPAGAHYVLGGQTISPRNLSAWKT